jgi:3-hydroxyisobutyrate dehydrogenase-like beta-hydroxyacid dehydrogenase
MARRIIDEGFPTTLWARRAESLEPFADTAADLAASRVELGAASDVLCVCVVADRDVDEVLRGPDGVLAGLEPGSVVVLHSTVHPDTCRRLQEDHPTVRVVDAPVSGGGGKAAERELLVMVGGEAEVVERCRPVLESFANPLVHLGPLGAGQEAKLLNNALFAAQLGLAADAFTVAIARGLDPEALATVFGSGSGRSYAGDLVGRGDFHLEVMAQLAGELLTKDVGILAELLSPDHPQLIEAAQAAVAMMARVQGEGDGT